MPTDCKIWRKTYQAYWLCTAWNCILIYMEKVVYPQIFGPGLYHVTHLSINLFQISDIIANLSVHIRIDRVDLMSDIIYFMTSVIRFRDIVFRKKCRTQRFWSELTNWLFLGKKSSSKYDSNSGIYFFKRNCPRVVLSL